MPFAIFADCAVLSLRYCLNAAILLSLSRLISCKQRGQYSPLCIGKLCFLVSCSIKLFAAAHNLCQLRPATVSKGRFCSVALRSSSERFCVLSCSSSNFLSSKIASSPNSLMELAQSCLRGVRVLLFCSNLLFIVSAVWDLYWIISLLKLSIRCKSPSVAICIFMSSSTVFAERLLTKLAVTLPDWSFINVVSPFPGIVSSLMKALTLPIARTNSVSKFNPIGLNPRAPSLFT